LFPEHEVYRVSYKGFWWGNLRKRDNLEDINKDGRVRLRWILKRK
jgi:hypothetical protein